MAVLEKLCQGISCICISHCVSQKVFSSRILNQGLMLLINTKQWIHSSSARGST